MAITICPSPNSQILTIVYFVSNTALKTKMFISCLLHIPDTCDENMISVLHCTFLSGVNKYIMSFAFV